MLHCEAPGKVLVAENSEAKLVFLPASPLNFGNPPGASSNSCSNTLQKVSSASAGVFSFADSDEVSVVVWFDCVGGGEDGGGGGASFPTCPNAVLQQNMPIAASKHFIVICSCLNVT